MGKDIENISSKNQFVLNISEEAYESDMSEIDRLQSQSELNSPIIRSESHSSVSTPVKESEEETDVTAPIKQTQSNNQTLTSQKKTSASKNDTDSIKKKPLGVKKIALRCLLCLFTTIAVLVSGILGAVTIINYGPSSHARDLFVTSVMETSAAKFLATWYFSDDEIKKIQNNNTVKPSDEQTNTELIQVNTKTNPQFDKNKVEVVKISAKKYKGIMLIVNDPSKVFVGTIPEFAKDKSGMTVTQMVKEKNCIAGINAGGFDDPGGVGKGGVPLGIVITEGKLKYGGLNSTYDMCGFDKEGKLHVGKMTGKQALDKGIRDAVSFGPTLIVNGNPSEISGTAGGWNPRTAIGQRADGSVLLLVIDGRQSDSIGATYGDLIQEMLKFEAINAYNLDGGTSSHMVYKDEIITSCSSLYGTRKMPTAILVKGDN